MTAQKKANPPRTTQLLKAAPFQQLGAQGFSVTRTAIVYCLEPTAVSESHFGISQRGQPVCYYYTQLPNPSEIFSSDTTFYIYSLLPNLPRLCCYLASASLIGRATTTIQLRQYILGHEHHNCYK